MTLFRFVKSLLYQLISIIYYNIRQFLVGSRRIFVAKYANKHNRYWLIYESCQMPIRWQESVKLYLDFKPSNFILTSHRKWNYKCQTNMLINDVRISKPFRTKLKSVPDESKFSSGSPFWIFPILNLGAFQCLNLHKNSRKDEQF